jgi:DNA-binding transcriptional MocR family regulator
MIHIMTIWPPDPANLSRPVYRSLAQVIVEAIAKGELKPGDRLPTHRNLATTLGLSVQTVTRAYDELIRADVISGQVGRGTFVNPSMPEGGGQPWHRIDGNESVIDCSMLTPVIGSLHEQAFSRTLASLAGSLPPETLFSFRPRQTVRAHVERAIDWLRICGVETQPDLVIPTNGATPAMTVALMTAAGHGDTVVTDEMSHHTMKALTRYLGLDLLGLPCDAQGIEPDAFEAACRTRTVRVLYAMPSANNPLARLMNIERRAALVAVARKHGVRIVENDAWGPLEPERPPPLASLAPERTFYFTSLTKCLLPGLRLGWLVVPEDMVTAAFGRHLVTNWMATALVAEIGSRWVADGTALRLLDWQREALARRNAIAATCLGDLPYHGAAHGLHLWLPLSGGWNESAFVNSARLRGVAVAAGSAFDTGVARQSGVRVCLGGPSESDLAEGLTILARLARNLPEPDFLAI